MRNKEKKNYVDMPTYLVVCYAVSTLYHDKALSIETERPEQTVQTQIRCHKMWHLIRFKLFAAHPAIFDWYQDDAKDSKRKKKVYERKIISLI